MITAVALLVVLLLAGCAGARPGPAQVVTEGFHTVLPAPGTRAVFVDFWDTARSPADYRPAEEGMLHEYIASWLRHVGIVFVVPSHDRWPLLQEQRFRLQQGDEQVRIGRMQGVALVVDLHYTTMVWDDPAVTIKATSVETGEIVWSGSASMRACAGVDRVSPRQVRFLADWALGTAFGLTTAGPHAVESWCRS